MRWRLDKNKEHFMPRALRLRLRPGPARKAKKNRKGKRYEMNKILTL